MCASVLDFITKLFTICTRSIAGHHWRKAVARDWHANGNGQLTLTGRLEMTQQSEYDLTNVEVGFKGLVENSGYHVHIVSAR